MRKRYVDYYNRVVCLWCHFSKCEKSSKNKLFRAYHCHFEPKNKQTYFGITTLPHVYPDLATLLLPIVDPAKKERIKQKEKKKKNFQPT